MRVTKDWHILLFSIIYLLCFPLIYALIYGDFNGYLLYLLIWMIINIPSFLIVLILLFYESYKGKKVPNYIYHLLSIILSSIIFLFFLNTDGDPKNIYPIFQENQFILILFSGISHLIAFSTIEFIKK